ncbi:unnamed protein product, partial [Coregonus sp. 'balchen']
VKTLTQSSKEVKSVDLTKVSDKNLLAGKSNGDERLPTERKSMINLKRSELVSTQANKIAAEEITVDLTKVQLGGKKLLL